MQQSGRGRPPVPEAQRRRMLPCSLELGTIARLDRLVRAQGRARTDLRHDALRGALQRGAPDQEAA